MQRSAPLPTLDEEQAVEAARTDVNAFVEYVMPPTKRGPFAQSAMHREWQSLFDHHTHVAILGWAESGKTSQIGLRLLFDLGHDPTLRCFILSGKEGSARKILGVVKRAIESNERVRKVFPDLRPGSVWTGHQLLLAGRQSAEKDFSVEALGWSGGWLGIRADRFVLDDINNEKNSRTPEMIEQINQTFDEKAQTRLTDGGRLWISGNAWSKDDLIHTLKDREGFEFRRYAVLQDDHRTPAWPEQWPIRRIVETRRRLPPLSFARMYMCLPLSSEDRRFEHEWFAAAKARGIKNGAVYNPDIVPIDKDTRRPWYVFTGVDLASGRKGRGSDSSALFTIAYHVLTKTRRVLDVQMGQWKAPELVARMQALGKKWDPVFAVENDGNQALFVDSFDLAGLRVLGLTTGGAKHDTAIGFESLAIDLHAGRWEIPANPAELTPDGDPASHPCVEQWIKDTVDYSPVVHTSDVAMAAWIADRCAREHSGNYFGILRRVRASIG